MSLFEEKDFLYKELGSLRRWNAIAALPEFIGENLKFELRPYQREAIENFIAYFEKDDLRRRPTQLLFHMATGSGKTLIMAALMIYLYQKGFRNFLFFVHLNNILDKTRENFLERASGKYLFADSLCIDGERVSIREVENFSDADPRAINICFTSIQQLNIAFNTVRENSLTFDDLAAEKLVLISDEAHHLNAKTKSGKKLDEARQTWEETVDKIFESNAENVLLEFTATCDLENEAIRAEYLDKIVFDYPLTKFYADGWSKEIIALKADVSIEDRELTAAVLSQYRQKVFARHRLAVKPVILFKSQRIAESQRNMTAFIEMMRTLTLERLEKILASNASLGRVRELFSMEELLEELRADFSELHCISANDERAAASVLNSLESPDNPYRAIFAVDKLDEGWDVLNLFDIVRLYETRQSGGKKISPTTISEAQLIGRGARYFPFSIDEREKYRRKFDDDLDGELRLCEVLFYHCQNDRRYIDELHAALESIGLNIRLERGETRELRLKQEFKETPLYRTGTVLVNKRIVDGVTDFKNIFRSAVVRLYTFKAFSGAGGEEFLLGEKILQPTPETASETKHERCTIGSIAKKNYAAVHKALIKYPIFRFDRLKEKFPSLGSTREFIEKEEYLGGVRLEIEARSIDERILHEAADDALNRIAEALSKAEKKYRGSNDWTPKLIREIFRDKTIKIDSNRNETVELQRDEWSAYEKVFGTSEESAFLKYFRARAEALRSKYASVCLIRNERELAVYDFEEGRRFEPDFVLLLADADGGTKQIFIEPKGAHLLENDAWKEKFLTELDGEVSGLHFFNRADEQLRLFDEDFQKLTEASER